jgi:hypothetical protein
MEHDFMNEDPKNLRYDSKKNLCTGIGGIMEGALSNTRWSSCSVEDFAAYADSMPKFCLDPVA